MTTTQTSPTQTRIVHARIAGNAKVHRAMHVDLDGNGKRISFTTGCGAETRFQGARRLIETTDAITCGRCSR